VKVFVVHVYDGADRLHDYYVQRSVEAATRKAACDVVEGRFEDLTPGDFDGEVARVAAAVYKEPSVGRYVVRCDAWHAQIDEMHVLPEEEPASASPPPIENAVPPVGHTCATQGRSNCAVCMAFEGKLWDAINQYAVSVGGDPENHVYGNVPRMSAVAAVGAIVGRCVPRALPTNPECQALIGTIGACGTDGHYCSDRCWVIGKLRSAQALVRQYEQRLGIGESR
jgi:hypothetical protein